MYPVLGNKWQGELTEDLGFQPQKAAAAVVAVVAVVAVAVAVAVSSRENIRPQFWQRPQE